MNSPTLAPKRFLKQQRAAFGIRRRIARRRVKLSLIKLKEKMVEIRKEQQCIKEEQGKVRQKFKIIESQCDILRKETELISQKSATTRLHLALVFQILKAREDNDFNRANDLTRTLRELIAKQNNTN
ncbi:hypothetical protein SLE2022_163450 [Rubroshorea leprosula]